MSLHDHAVEAAVIAATADASLLDAAQARLTTQTLRLAPEDFHDSRHRAVWTAILAVLERGQAADVLSLKAELKSPLDHKWLTGLLMRPDTWTGTLPGHAEHLRDLSLRRRAVAAAADVQRQAGDRAQPMDAVLTAGAQSWASLTKEGVSVQTGAEHTLRLMDDLDAAQRGELALTVPTGIDVWDQVMGGLEGGVLTFIASQPGVGKSSVIATMLGNLALRTKVGLFSLEDLGRWLPMRLISRESAVPVALLAKKPLRPYQMERVAEAAGRVHPLLQNVLIDERSMLTAPQIVQTARHMVINLGARVVFIDHLGKVAHKRHGQDGFDLGIEDTLNHLSALAKEHRIPVVVACHLKRSGQEGDIYRRPEATDFARTAFIERDARNAIGLYLERDNPDVLNCAVLKQTNGACGEDFPLRRLQECGLVSSRNGKLSIERDDERRIQLKREQEAA